MNYKFEKRKQMYNKMKKSYTLLCTQIYYSFWHNSKRNYEFT